MLVDQYHVSTPLKVLLKDFVDQAWLDACDDVQISGLSIDSRDTRKGDLFIAGRGVSAHALRFADQAVDQGASAVLWDECDGCDDVIEKISQQTCCLHCDGLKMKTGEIADRFYQRPSSKLKVTGVTGTNGKTSVAHFIAQCMDQADRRCGVLGTLGNGFPGELSMTGLTTADAVSVQRDLEMLRANKATNVVMEVSSHGLDQGRVNGVLFDSAVFTNLSQDHLDYHETLEAYAEVKRQLFFMPGLNAAVINLDDNYGRVLAKECKSRLSVWGYSTQAEFDNWQDYADHLVQAVNIRAVARGFKAVVKTPQGDGDLFVPLLGGFNVSNVLAVLSILLINGFSLEKALKNLAGISPVSGRMEVINAKGKPSVVVDFAHTPAALEEACKAIKKHFNGQLWCVFGCGGDRDKSKRPLMAKAAEEYADKVVVTSDNPRTEVPRKIIDEIVAGFDDVSKAKVIIDRRDAIVYAIEQAQENDVVLLAGKGHERVQIVGDKTFEFDDRKVAKQYLGVAQ
ncbi:MAG: UDP-N-acetylmuramoyl-L-alanyl-D-glutamate--2,6-diaminopimelate ligase [Gammaproteobacteria bacterium]|nr:UDP-N-acetylmuramoyl-L-alanyl-D-glutamate--2,6-diaminopimelate ligase [Gammaproteobacteria bacterium]